MNKKKFSCNCITADDEEIGVGQFPLKWVDPADSSFAVIDDRGWQHELGIL